MTFVVATNFSRGEVDPAVMDRQDQEFYPSAVAKFSNWWADVAGYAFSRPPLEVMLVDAVEIGDGRRRTSRVVHTMIVRSVEYVVVFDWLADPDKVLESLLSLRVFNAEDSMEVLNETISTASTSYVLDLNLHISVAQAGYSLFLASLWFRPMRIVFPTSGPVELSQIVFYAQLFGTLTPTLNTNTWTGTDTIFRTQMDVGDTLLFRGKTYTIATLDSQVALTTVETYTDPTLTDRGAYLVANKFSGDMDRPRFVTFYGNRLIYFSSRGAPTAMWASQTNQPFIIVPAGIEDDAPINVEYLAEGLDEFSWVVVTDRLYLGSLRGEYAIGTVGEGLTPTTSTINRIGSSGGARNAVVTTGDVVYFVDAAKVRVLAAQFDFYRQATVTNDISLLSPHLLRDGIVQIAHRPGVGDDRTPRLMVMTKGGGLVTCGIQPDQNTISWATVDIDGYDVNAVAASKSTAYVSVNGDNGTDSFWVLSRFGTARSGGFLLDLAVEYAASPFVQLQAWQFEKTYGVYSSQIGFLGYFVPDAFGIIDLSAFDGLTGTVSVGLAYQPEMKLLPVRITEENGSRLNRKRRIVRTLVDVLDTSLLYINGAQVVGNASAPTGTDVVPQSGVFSFRTLGWGYQDGATISAPAGYPATIRSITREVV